jgi:hypothetical protein
LARAACAAGSGSAGVVAARSDEHRQRFDRNAEIALQPRHAAIELVEALGGHGFRRSAASGDRKDAIAASAISDRE